MAALKANIVIFLIKCFALLPFSFAQRLGGWAGWLVWTLHLEPRKITLINLKLCFPDMSESERLKLAKASVIETGKVFAEVAMMWERDTESVLSLIREIEGEHLIHEAEAKGKGILFLGPHLGNWEMAGLFLASRYKMATLYRPPKIQELDAYIARVRGRSGAELVPTDKRGVVRLFSVLKEGGVVGILPDQVASGNAGVHVPFYGVEAKTIRLVSKLVEKTRPAVLCAFAERLPNARGFRLVILPADEGIYDSDLMSSVTALNKSVESCVDRIPTQYQWEYKRFKQPREGMPRYY